MVKTVDQSGIRDHLQNKANGTTGSGTKEDNNFNNIIKKELENNFPAIKSLVPKHMTPERLARITLTAISRTPKLALCTTESIIGAVMNCATLGLEPNLIGHAYLVPYWNHKMGKTECQFQIGYKGYIDLIRRTGDVSKIYAETVYENDLFIYFMGEDKRLIHIPFDMLHLLENFLPNKEDFVELMMGEALKKIKERNAQDPGKPIRYYAAYRLKDSAFDFVTMTEEQCLKHAEKHSSSKDRESKELIGPWKDHKPMMCKKTCIKELVKLMPISIEIQEKLTTDEATLKIKKDNGIESDSIFDVEYHVVSEDGGESSGSESSASAAGGADQ